MTAIKRTKEGQVLVATLVRGEAGNSITAEFFRDFMAVINEAERDDAVRAVLTCADGANFCVGADAGNLNSYAERSLQQIHRDDFSGRIGLTAPDEDDLGTGICARAIYTFKKPLVAAINGAAAGGGLSFALLHHFRICSASAKFTTAFSRLGIGPELGMSATLPDLVGRQTALEMELSSRLVRSEEALQIGLVDKRVEDQALRNEALQFAHRLSKVPPLAAAAILERYRGVNEDALTAALKQEWADQRKLFASDDFKEGISALQEKRAANFKGR